MRPGCDREGSWRGSMNVGTLVSNGAVVETGSTTTTQRPPNEFHEARLRSRRMLENASMLPPRGIKPASAAGVACYCHHEQQCFRIQPACNNVDYRSLHWLLVDGRLSGLSKLIGHAQRISYHSVPVMLPGFPKCCASKIRLKRCPKCFQT